MDYEQEEYKTEDVVFTKDGILKSKRYAHRVDLLGVLLVEDKEYTFDQVDTLINHFMNGGV